MHAFVAAGGHDGSQLTTMGMQAQQVVGKEELTMIAVRGYFNGSEINLLRLVIAHTAYWITNTRRRVDRNPLKKR